MRNDVSSREVVGRVYVLMISQSNSPDVFVLKSVRFISTKRQASCLSANKNESVNVSSSQAADGRFDEGIFR